MPLLSVFRTAQAEELRSQRDSPKPKQPASAGSVIGILAVTESSKWAERLRHCFPTPEYDLLVAEDWRWAVESVVRNPVPVVLVDPSSCPPAFVDVCTFLRTQYPNTLGVGILGETEASPYVDEGKANAVLVRSWPPERLRSEVRRIVPTGTAFQKCVDNCSRPLGECTRPSKRRAEEAEDDVPASVAVAVDRVLAGPEGGGFLIEAVDPHVGCQLFKAVAAKGRACLLFNRKLCGAAQLESGEGNEVVWISPRPREGVRTLQPGNLARLLSMVQGFFRERPGGVVVCAATECLLGTNGFTQGLRLVQHMLDLAMASGGRVVVAMNPEVLSEQERHHVRRELEVLNPVIRSG